MNNVLTIDPHYTIFLVREALHTCPAEVQSCFRIRRDIVKKFTSLTQPQKRSSESPTMKLSEQLLQSLLNIMPGQIEARTLLAKIQYLKLDAGAAAFTIESALESEQYGPEAETLLVAAEVWFGTYSTVCLWARLRCLPFCSSSQPASSSVQIHAHQGNMAKAAIYLDKAIANNFRLKENLHFVVLQAQLLVLDGKLQEAATSLSAVLDWRGVRKYSIEARYSLQDRCTVFLALSEIYLKLKRAEKVKAVLQLAADIFKETAQEPRIILARAEALIAEEPASKAAINLLETVDPEKKEYYFRAQERIAATYLRNGDRDKYAEIYEELYSAMGETITATVMLGEAYMRIPQV